MSAPQDFDFEEDYWGNCTNTFDEEQKHYVYARCMGLFVDHYRIIMPPQSRILDVGGGPVSMMLKVQQLRAGLVWDPLVYPDWTRKRYQEKNIGVIVGYGEDLKEKGWDEVWLYNCLQHTHDPAKVVQNCLKAGKVFRIFEWLDIPPHDGHPQMLTRELLDKWTGATGQTQHFNNHHGCTGHAYFNTIQTGN